MTDADLGLPPADAYFARLHPAGWGVGDIGLAYQADDTNNGKRAEGHGGTQAGAWAAASQHAEAVGGVATVSHPASWTRIERGP
jgi:hypothetical protein